MTIYRDSRLEAVTDANFGQNVARLGRVFFNLLPQMADVHPQALMVLDGLVPPYLRQQVPMRQYTARVRCQRNQESVLNLRQMKLRLAPDNRAIDTVDGVVAEAQDGLVRTLASLMTSQQCTRAGQQLGYPEGLG